MGETGSASVQAAEIIAGDPFARHLGIEMLHLGPGHSRLRMRLTPAMQNFNGLAHGGAIFALADAAFAAASNAHGTVAIALTMSIQFLEPPGPGSRLIAEAREVRRGRRTGFYEITVTEEDGREVARCQGVAHRRPDPLTNHRAGGAGP